MTQTSPEGRRTLMTDVVVVGAGPSGMAAVAAASAAGVEVVAVEAREHIRANAVWSTGYLAFVDSDAQWAEGIVDTVEAFVADARRMVDEAQERFGVVWDENLVRLFARESTETYRILVERGIVSRTSSLDRSSTRLIGCWPPRTRGRINARLSTRLRIIKCHSNVQITCRAAAVGRR